MELFIEVIYHEHNRRYEASLNIEPKFTVYGHGKSKDEAIGNLICNHPGWINGIRIIYRTKGG